MPTWLEDMRTVGLSAAGGGGGLIFVRWLANFIGGRMDRRADRLDADTRFIIDQLRAEVKRMADRLSTAEVEIDDLKGQLAECQHEHAVSRAEHDHLKALLLATGPGLKRAFLPDDCMPNDMAVMAANLDGDAA